MLNKFSRNPAVFILTIILLATSACAGKKEEPAPQTATQVVCPPLPSPCPVLPEPPDPLQLLEDKIGVVKAKATETAAKMQITDKIGKKELSPEDFGKMASFLWAVDPALRVAYLRALDRTNQLVDMVKPPDGGKFDPMAVPADPEQDISFRISEVIVDWAQVQRVFVDGMQTLGAENVKAVGAQDDFPQGEAMMRDLIPLLAPPPPPAPAEKLLPGALRLILSDALAQTQKTARGAKTLPKIPVKALTLLKGMPRIQVAKAPLLLARTMSFKVGNAFFVLDSPLMKSIPEFKAVPVEQFTFKLERKFVGDDYFNEVSGVVTQLAALPQRSQPEWRETAYGLTELQVLLKLLNPNFGEAPPLPTPLPGQPVPGLTPPAGMTPAGVTPVGIQPAPSPGTPLPPAAPPGMEKPAGAPAVPAAPALPEPILPSGAPPPIPKS